jgi:hypothetical protein
VRTRSILLALIALTGVAGCEVVPIESAPPSTSDAFPDLDSLTVARAGSMRGYDRDKFPHWARTGDNCDVRDSVLKRDGVDIDHVVPLANAWRSGASAWAEEKREEFANDLDRPQLVAVSSASNRSKGDQDPSGWKPTVRSEWCVYATDWISVKSYWKLSVTSAEKAALADMLEEC